MNKIEKELYELCSEFLLLLYEFKKKGKISKAEYESHAKLKRIFINQKKANS
ncbi:hypothetical protein K8M07_11385 [Schnuerera sp. xch1]|uniref:hypothetical protein n=1 Tax=Schnuerera sp. xch1 TaxID=2874283 RepID=UPI001CBE9FAB|nr:hypothetical protein [Schnuerera sp. xch1]MBZ2175839.1 hypothetical protein [Schnuerera sp. xch1]